MATLVGQTIAATYGSLLKTSSNTPNLVSGATTERIVFSPDADASDRTPLYVSQDRIGIGTPTPGTILHLNGTSADAVLKIEAGSGAYEAAIQLEPDSGEDSADRWDLKAHEDNNFYITNTNSETKRLTILSGGPVGIGTPTPVCPLEVSEAKAMSDAAFDGADGDMLAVFTNTHNTAYGAAAIKLKKTHADADHMIVYNTAGDVDSSFKIWDETGGGRVTIDSLGHVGIGGDPLGLRLNVVGANTNTDVGKIESIHGSSFTNVVLTTACNKTAASNFWLFRCNSDGGTAEFTVRGDGTAFGEGGTVQTADYAEFFESGDGKAIALGTSVVLVDGKVRAAKNDETPFGVVSSTLGNASAWKYWHKKYLKDNYGTKIVDEDPEAGGVWKINPDWDEDTEYTPREERDEWNSIGLLGQVPITKGQSVASSWIKMSEVSDTVDMYYIFPVGNEDAKIAALETEDVANKAKIVALEAKDTEYDTTITALTARITALESA